MLKKLVKDAIYFKNCWNEKIRILEKVYKGFK